MQIDVLAMSLTSEDRQRMGVSREIRLSTQYDPPLLRTARKPDMDIDVPISPKSTAICILDHNNTMQKMRHADMTSSFFRPIQESASGTLEHCVLHRSFDSKDDASISNECLQRELVGLSWIDDSGEMRLEYSEDENDLEKSTDPVHEDGFSAIFRSVSGLSLNNTTAHELPRDPSNCTLKRC